MINYDIEPIGGLGSQLLLPEREKLKITKEDTGYPGFLYWKARYKKILKLHSVPCCRWDRNMIVFHPRIKLAKELYRYSGDPLLSVDSILFLFDEATGMVRKHNNVRFPAILGFYKNLRHRKFSNTNVCLIEDDVADDHVRLRLIGDTGYYISRLDFDRLISCVGPSRLVFHVMWLERERVIVATDVTNHTPVAVIQTKSEMQL